MLEHDINFMAIETGGMFDRLIENGFDKRSTAAWSISRPARNTAYSQAHERRMGFTRRRLP